MTIGDRLRDRLAERSMSQSELARRVHLTQGTIAALISGKSRTTAHLHKIARELGTTPAYLAGETDDPEEGAPPPPELSHQEIDLLEQFRLLDPKDQAALMQLARTIATRARSPAGPGGERQKPGATTLMEGQ